MDETTTNVEIMQELKSLRSLVEKQAALISYYEGQLLMMKRHCFGSSSEKTDTDLRQVTLFGDAAQIKPSEVKTEEITYKRTKRKGKREEDLSVYTVLSAI